MTLAEIWFNGNPPDPLLLTIITSAVLCVMVGGMGTWAIVEEWLNSRKSQLPTLKFYNLLDKCLWIWYNGLEGKRYDTQGDEEMAKYTGAEMAYDAAWDSGYTARRFNDPITSNPWCIITHKAQHNAWRKGWAYRDSQPNPADLA